MITVVYANQISKYGLSRSVALAGFVLVSWTTVLAQPKGALAKSVPETTPVISYRHAGRVESLAISPDGNSLATESVRDGVRISYLRNGKLQTFIKHVMRVWSLAFSHDGTILATGNSDGNVRLWDEHTGQLLKTLPVGRWNVYAIAFSPDRNTIACGEGDGPVQVWDFKKAQRLMTLGKEGERVNALAFSGDGKLLATLTSENRTYVWDAATGRLMGTMKGRGLDSRGSVSFCPDHKTVNVANNGDVQFWNPLEKGKPKKVRIPDSIDAEKKFNRQVAPHDGPIFIGITVVSPDCNRAATVQEDGSIAIWNITTREISQVLTGSRIPNFPGGGVEKMVFSPDGEFLVSGKRNGVVEVWDIK